MAANHQKTVMIPGTRIQLVLETDPATGRTVGRIDGRAVMRPLAADEEEREFTAGGNRYLLRRLPEGEFDVDIDVSQLSATSRTWDPVPVPAAPARKKTGLVLSGFTVLLLVFTGRVIFRQVRKFISPSSSIEVTRFTCERAGRKNGYETFEAIAELTNRSSRPLSLTGHVSMIGMANSKTLDYQAAVDPSPLPPDATGRLYIRDYVPDMINFADGQCRLDAFRDEKGHRLQYGQPR